MKQLPSLPSFSVIIPTLNEEAYIEQIITSVLQQSIQAKTIFVVDGKSSDKTIKKVRPFKSVKIICSQPSVGAQRNLGAQRAQSDWLIFLDADVQLPTDFFKKMFVEIIKHNLTIACPLYYTNSKSVSSKIFFGFFSWLFWMCQWILPAGAGPCIFIKKSVFDTSRGFKSIKFEDLELINRISRKERFRLVPVPVYISDRRLQKEGLVISLFKYTAISFFFLFGQLTSPLAQQIEYQFGKYKQ